MSARYIPAQTAKSSEVEKRLVELGCDPESSNHLNLSYASMLKAKVVLITIYETSPSRQQHCPRNIQAPCVSDTDHPIRILHLTQNSEAQMLTHPSGSPTANLPSELRSSAHFPRTGVSYCDGLSRLMHTYGRAKRGFEAKRRTAKRSEAKPPARTCARSGL